MKQRSPQISPRSASQGLKTPDAAFSARQPGASKSPGISIGSRFVPLSNLEKIYYPSVAFTKGQVIDYYIRIAPVLLPHLKGRALTLKRYPNGVEESFFYEKRCPSHRPQWMKTALVKSEKQEEAIGFCIAADLPSLVWIANTGSLELHTSLSLAAQPERPTAIVFDLDPGDNTTVVECGKVGLLLKDILGRLNLETVVKTSGSKGLQVYAPLNTAVTYDDTKPFAKAIAQLLEQEYPNLVVSNMKKSLRVGKIFVDWSQNDFHKTTVSVYSLRARNEPTVSTPVTWQEVQASVEHNNPSLLKFDSSTVLKRIEAHGDLFLPMIKLKQKLPELSA